MHGTRHTLYTSLEALASDSSDVVRVVVLDQTEVEDDLPYTLSTVEVRETYHPSSLGRNVDRDGTLQEGEHAVIRQFGGASWEELPAAIVAPGETYLLFVTPTMLDGAEAEYYVTGGSAGLYRPGTDGRFAHVGLDEGDALPDPLSEHDLSK